MLLDVVVCYITIFYVTDTLFYDIDTVNQDIHTLSYIKLSYFVYAGSNRVFTKQDPSISFVFQLLSLANVSGDLSSVIPGATGRLHSVHVLAVANCQTST